MNWVSNKVLTDIRNELFGKMLSHSMDFFNKMQSGFLMSRITNDTRMMQTALSSISSDLFKQPVAIIGGISVLLYMDWKFTIVTLVLFPSCLDSAQHVWQAGAQGGQERAGGHGPDGRDDAGNVSPAFGWSNPSRARSTRKNPSGAAIDPVRQCDAHCALDGSESVRWSKSSPPSGSALALLYVYFENLPAAKFIALIGGIFLLYEPIKTLSRMHITMQRSIAGDDGNFRILDSESDRPGSRPTR